MLSVFKEGFLSWCLAVLTTSCPKAAAFIHKASLCQQYCSLFKIMCIHSLIKLNYNYFVYLSQKFGEKNKRFSIVWLFSLFLTNCFSNVLPHRHFPSFLFLFLLKSPVSSFNIFYYLFNKGASGCIAWQRYPKVLKSQWDSSCHHRPSSLVLNRKWLKCLV